MEIQRKLLNNVLNHLTAKEMTVITGARQTGKTTLIKEVEKQLRDKGEKTLYLDLDFEPDFRYFETHETFLQKLHLELGEGPGYVFIDEIQRKENAGLFLKGIYDRQMKIKFIVTGSGSMDLKARIRESLAGRKRMFEMLPVTFYEFVSYKTGYKYDRNLDDFFKLENQKIRLLLLEYFSFGGYPRVVTEPLEKEKFYQMNEIFQAYMYKDISYLLGLDKPESFIKLTGLLGVQTGHPLNYTTLAKDAGISVPTVKKYIWYLENTFIIKQISPFFRNKRKEITKAPVIYFCDTGFRNYLLHNFSLRPDLSDGMLFQNFVFNLLYDYHLTHPEWEIHYWRTLAQAEVDFVMTQGDRLLPVEVKSSPLTNTALSRSLISFIEKYHPARALVVNLSLSAQRIIGSTQVEFLPFYGLQEALG